MNEIVFIGLGLHDEMGISLSGLEEAKSADTAFMEAYTSLMPNLSIQNLESMIGKTVKTVSRKQLEEENGKMILDSATTGKTVLLVPGDPLIATTHVTLRIEAQKRGISTRIIHGASAISAVIGLSGLHNYKFGKTVTIPFPDETPPETPYQVILQNKKLGLHTLCLLDIKAEQKRYLTIHDALTALSKTERNQRKKVMEDDSLAVGVARAGSETPTVRAGTVGRLLAFDFGGPPYTLIFPGELHFMEAEALIRFAGAPEKLRETAR